MQCTYPNCSCQHNEQLVNGCQHNEQLNDDGLNKSFECLADSSSFFTAGQDPRTVHSLDKVMGQFDDVLGQKFIDNEQSKSHGGFPVNNQEPEMQAAMHSVHKDNQIDLDYFLNFAKKKRNSAWRMVLILWLCSIFTMAGAIIYLKYPQLDRFPIATALLLSFFSGAFSMATLINLKRAVKDIYNSQYGLTSVIIILCLCLVSCKKETARDHPVCYVCTDAAGNGIDAICAPTRDSAYHIANSLCPGGDCGMTMDQFTNKCQAQ